MRKIQACHYETTALRRQQEAKTPIHRNFQCRFTFTQAFTFPGQYSTLRSVSRQGNYFINKYIFYKKKKTCCSVRMLAYPSSQFIGFTTLLTSKVANDKIGRTNNIWANRSKTRNTWSTRWKRHCWHRHFHRLHPSKSSFCVRIHLQNSSRWQQCMICCYILL